MLTIQKPVTASKTLCHYATEYPLVDKAYDTEKDDTRSTECQRQAGSLRCCESRQWLLGAVDVHGLYNEQIVVKADHCINKGYEYYYVS